MAHVLIVDDDDALRMSLCRLLCTGGFAARGVADGAAALLAMRAEPPALVLLDMSMPVMTGMDVLREASTDPSLAKVPIVILTAVDSPATREEAAKLGACEFLVKGRDWPEALWRVVDQFVRPSAVKPQPARERTTKIG